MLSLLRRSRLLLHADHGPNGVDRAAGVAEAVIADRRRRRLEAAGAAVLKTRHSGVQLEVLALYRGLLKEANRRTDAKSRLALRSYIQTDFRTNKSIAKKEVARIEWLIHYGRARLEDLQHQKASTGFSIMHPSDKQ